MSYRKLARLICSFGSTFILYDHGACPIWCSVTPLIPLSGLSYLNTLRL